MNTSLYDIQNYKQLESIFEKWETFSNNLEVKPINMPLVIPDMLWKTSAGVGKTDLINRIAKYLSTKNNLMDFYGDAQYFEFYLNYCEPMEQFDEIRRLMFEVQNAAGFRNEFRGIIHIDISEWVKKSHEKHFKTFLEYIADNSDDWLIILSIPNLPKSETKDIEALINAYLRIETYIFELPELDEFYASCSIYLQKYNLTLAENAEDFLKSTITALKESEHFDGFKTLKKLCLDIVYHIYSSQEVVDTYITAETLSPFASDGEYIHRVIEKAQKRIGFAVGGDVNV